VISQFTRHCIDNTQLSGRLRCTHSRSTHTDDRNIGLLHGSPRIDGDDRIHNAMTMPRCFFTSLSFCVVMHALGSKCVVSFFEDGSKVVTCVSQEMTNNNNIEYRCTEEMA